MLDLVISTLLMFWCARGVTRLLSPPLTNDFLIEISVIVDVPDGIPPSQTPVTVEIPETLIVSPSVETPVTTLNVGIFNPEIE